MPGIEIYQKNPGGKLEKLLEAWQWERVGLGLWENAISRLYVDAVGIFFYRLQNGAWVRRHGLAHNLIFPRKHEIVFLDGSRLNLMDGEFSCQAK